MQVSLWDICAAVGVLAIAYLSYNGAGAVLFLFNASTLARYQRSRGPTGDDRAWALVTGASDGVGKGFAQELCHLGFNVILHGRSQQKLAAVKEELQREFPSQVRLLVLDAAAAAPWTPAREATVLRALDGVALTVVVNNVGGAGGVGADWCRVVDRSAGEFDALINLNARFMTQLTRAVLPVLAQNQPALVLNVSSVAEVLPIPYMAVYAATKAYVSAWTRCLGAEMRAEHLDVEVMSLILGMVVTPGTGRDSSMESLVIPSARTVARASFAKIGCGAAVIVPYWPHRLQLRLFGLLPEALVQKLMLRTAREEMERMRKKKGE